MPAPSADSTGADASRGWRLLFTRSGELENRRMLLVFRVICAVLVAWAMNWAMGRPEAATIQEEVPLYAAIVPLAGAIVGFLNLAKRQGWGFIVAVANGLWAGALSLFLAGFITVAIMVEDASRDSIAFNFENLLRVMARETADIVDRVAYLPLIVVALGATAVVGLVSEVIHWALVRLRKRRPEASQTSH